MDTRLTRVLPVAALLVAGFATSATAAVINGTSGDDVLTGTAKGDTIHGLAGDDVLKGLRGEDTMYGGPGADQLYGGKDTDRQAWPDLLYGGPGADRIVAHQSDKVYAGRGNDTVKVAGAFIVVRCGPGDDTVDVRKGAAFYKLIGCEHKVR